ncbi:MAG TPA: hypothetical protein VGQ18_10490 [Gemmatimonadales bacterium]|nr:hypothetical protein [Gemmatimonadales bacterium]
MRRSTLEAKYPNGLEGYRRDCPNATFCADGELTRIGFMVPADVQVWINHLTSVGLLFIVDGEAADFVVVDQFKGATTPCSWLSGGRHPAGFSAVWLAGTDPGEVAHPPGWTPSQSASLTFVPIAEVSDRVLPLTSAGVMDVLLDFKTGKEVYIGRVLQAPAPPPRASPSREAPSVASPALVARKRLKSAVFAQIGVAAVALVCGRLARSVELWWLSTFILWIAYLRHAWFLWSVDPQTYPRFLNLWPTLFRRLRGGQQQPDAQRFFPAVALEVAFAPLLASSVWFVWQWIGWTCGLDTDRYSEIPVSQPFWPTLIQLFVIGYYWWTVHKRFKGLGAGAN